jgi:predicted Kef-type K+ transport protein
MGALELTLVYLLAAVLGVVACRSLKLPPMLGYLAVGVVIGPNALALAENSEGVRHLGEFGVVFLMFVIGLEFNLAKLRSMRRHVFGLGLFHADRHAGHIGAGLAHSPLLGHELADCAGLVQRTGHEQHRDRRQADGRAA